MLLTRPAAGFADPRHARRHARVLPLPLVHRAFHEAMDRIEGD
jgi:hypothetical protein